MEIPIFIGIDVGATSMRASIVDGAGTVVATRRGVGVNPFSAAGGRDVLVDTLRDTVKTILPEPRSTSIGAVVVGIAGFLARPQVGDDVTQALSSLGIDTVTLVVHDAETMFASGSVQPDGYCLSVGTGAIAVAIRDHRIRWKVDGDGWLLGDHGSAVWIGISAVRSVLRALDGRSDATSLVDDVPRLLGDLTGRPCPPESPAIVVAVHELRPAMLGRLAPLVGRHAQRGDPSAGEIIQDAARRLGETMLAVVRDDEGLPIVLGGSVVWENITIRRHLQRLVRDRWPRSPLHVVRSGTAGAALWARRIAGHVPHQDTLSKVREAVDGAQETFSRDEPE